MMHIEVGAACCCTLLMLVCGLDFVLGARDDEVLIPPVFTTPAKSEYIYVNKRANYSVSCQAKGTPEPTYRWWVNGSAVEVGPRVKVGMFDGTLTFSDYRADLSGEYICLAVSKTLGDNPITVTALSPVQKIQVFSTGKFTDPRGPVELNVVETLHVALLCNRTQGSFGLEYKLHWYDATFNQLTDFDNGRLYEDTKGGLHFANVKPTDSGSYKCGVAVSDSPKIVLNKGYYTLEVTEDEAHSPIPFYLAYSNDGVTANLYSQVILECFFAGYEPSHTNANVPVITWKDKNQNNIDEKSKKYSISEDTRRLTIHRVEPEDKGHYWCSVAATEPTSVFLNITSPPYFVDDKDQPKKLIVTPNGKDVNISCNAVSIPGDKPPETPIWFVNGIRYTTEFDQQKYQLSADSKHMTLLNVRKPRDIQCLQCLVSNNVGSTWSGGCLRVIDPIEVITRPNPVLEIEKGDVVDVTVRAISDSSLPVLTYSWEFAGAVTEGAAPSYVTTNGTRDIVDTALLDEDLYQTIGGVYIVHIRNLYDEATVEFKIVLLDAKDDDDDDGFLAKFDFLDDPLWLVLTLLAIFHALVFLFCLYWFLTRKEETGVVKGEEQELNEGPPVFDPYQEDGDDLSSRPSVFSSEVDEAFYTSQPASRSVSPAPSIPVSSNQESIVSSLSEFPDVSAQYKTTRYF